MVPGAHGTGAVDPPSDAHKRKRDADDNGTQPAHSGRIPQPPPPQAGNGAPINYLSRASPARLRLIQDDSDAFTDILSLIGDYEGVLSRHESLAANLGAKLTAPRLLRAMESLFEGTITVIPDSPYRDARASTIYKPTWLEVIAFAKSHPGDLNLIAAPDGRRVCQFVMKNVRVEISEDDWRLIMSSTLDRFRLAPARPLEEDEATELATLDILEQPVQTLIKKADEVARRARQLNYHLSGRKAAINSRRSPPVAQQGSGFQSMNQPPARSGGPNPGYDLHADLLQQFLVPAPQQALSSASTASLPALSEPPRLRQPTQLVTPSTRPSSVHADELAAYRDHQSESAEDISAAHRPLIQARIEKLARGDPISPPCDRCRRLKTSCVKHLTACQGCTRKHAKCSWKGVTDEEVAALRGELVYGHGLGRELRGLEAADPAVDERDDSLMTERSSSHLPIEPGEGSRVLRDTSSRHRQGSRGQTAGSASNNHYGSRDGSTPPRGRSGGIHLAHLLLQDPDDDNNRSVDTPPPPLDKDEDGSSARGTQGSHDTVIRRHLSHMASVATAAAEARESYASMASRGSTPG